MNCLQNNCTCANPRGNLVYLTKVFYDAEENASPILTALTTTTAGFSQQLSVGGSVCNNIASNCSSGCGNTIIPAADAAVQTTADVAAIYVKRYAAVVAATPADAAI